MLANDFSVRSERKRLRQKRRTRVSPTPQAWQALRLAINPSLLPNAERAEDEIEDVITSRGSRNLIERTQRVIKIEEQHFVGNFIFDREFGGGEGC